jgi:hypothetical protein
MRAEQIINLIEVGGTGRARAYLKKLSLVERLPLLHACFPYITTSNRFLFFQEHFTVEFVALAETNFNYVKAEERYRVLLRSKY